MDREQYALMHEVERSHWWYRGMRRNAQGLLRRYLARGRSYSILDAGCGTGGTTVDLAEFGTVTGIDLSPDALSFAAGRGLRRLVRGSLERLPFPDACFDVWTSFDVLYHRSIEDERTALSEAHRVLRPGSVALFREPAFDWLRGSHDVAIHTQRRFTAEQLSERIRDAGFRIQQDTYGNTFLFPLALGKRIAERLLPTLPDDLAVPPRPVNSLLEALLSLEGPLLSHFRFPIGLSVVIVARKGPPTHPPSASSGQALGPSAPHPRFAG